MDDVTPAAPAPALPPLPPRRPAGNSDPARTVPRFGARWVALMAGTLIALYLCWLMVAPFVEVLLWAGVLVVVFFPVHEQILRRVRSPNLAALLSCVIVAVTILGPVTLVTIAVVGEAPGAIDNVQAGINKVLDPNTRIHEWVGNWINLDEFRSDEWKKDLVSALQGKGGTIAGQAVSIAGKVLAAVVKIFFVAFTMYYFFRDSTRIRAALLEVLPLELEQSELIFAHTREVIAASVNGVIVIAAVQGTLGGLAFAILGIPSPLMWGAIMFITSMIPLGGSAIVWAPASLYLLLTGHWLRSILLVAWGTMVIGMLDNVLRPKLVGNRTRLHELLVFFSVIGGLAVFGPLGLVVGPVVVAITLALVDVFRQVQRPVTVTVKEPSVIAEQDALRDVPAERQSPEAREAAREMTHEEARMTNEARVTKPE